MDVPLFYVASTYRRVGASIVDAFLWIVPMSLFFLLGYFRFDSNGIFFSIIPYLALVLFAFLIEFFFLFRFSQTPGKMLLRIYVVDAKNHSAKLTATQALIRTLCRNLYVLFSLAPAVIALFREDRRQLLDLIAGTQVVQKENRSSAPQKRWIIGSFFFCYFFVGSLYNLINTFKYVEFQSDGIYIHNSSSSSPGKGHHEPVN
jgi:uncharacterized RDD family membrane protein YckC